jgi:formiminotetrahydrofolate cyclodeaminase
VADGGDSVRPFLERPVEELLADLAARTSAPGGGSAVALAVAFAAALVEMAARFSDDAADVAARAAALRARAAPLVQEDAEAYAAVLAAMRQPAEHGEQVTREAVGRALEGAAAVPLEVTMLAADVAALAARLAESGNPNLRGDAACAAALAHGAARGAALLVALNLAARPGDERVVRARALASAAEEAAARALAH